MSDRVAPSKGATRGEAVTTEETRAEQYFADFDEWWNGSPLSRSRMRAAYKDVARRGWKGCEALVRQATAKDIADWLDWLHHAEASKLIREKYEVQP